MGHRQKVLLREKRPTSETDGSRGQGRAVSLGWEHSSSEQVVKDVRVSLACSHNRTSTAGELRNNSERSQATHHQNGEIRVKLHQWTGPELQMNENTFAFQGFERRSHQRRERNTDDRSCEELQEEMCLRVAGRFSSALALTVVANPTWARNSVKIKSHVQRARGQSNSLMYALYCT
ncbi:hypothetical protein BGW80DRAFT_1506763 [Lactifluus volemus]|nr:hypothetical protein BGW80DRAFT_1506763 [Lactifluus volemus]